MANQNNTEWQILNTSPDPHCVIDEKGKFLFANDALLEVIGKEVSQVQVGNFFNLIFNEDIEEAVNDVQAAVDGKQDRFTSRLVCKENAVVLFDWNVRPEGDKIVLSGRPTQTAISALEQPGTGEGDHLNTFIKYAPAAIAMFDKNMKYIAASKRWYQDYQLDETDIIGKTHYDVFPRLSPEWKRIHEWCLQGHIESREQDSFIDEKGHTQWLKWEIHPWYVSSGEVGGIIMFTELITEQKKAEAELLKRNRELEKLKRATLNILEDIEDEKNRASQEKEKLSLILQSIGDGVVVLDEDQRIVLTNSVTSELSGYTQSEMIGQLYYETLKFVDKNNKIYTRFIDEVYTQGAITSLGNDISLIRKDGTTIAVADSAAPIRINNIITGCIIIFRDSTRERQVDQMKSDFVSIASHQLRTPLTAVKWYAELLSSELQNPTDEQKELISEIVTSNQRMIMLVNDLLSVSHIERQAELKLEKTEVKLHKLVEQVIKDNSTLSAQQDIKVHNNVPPELALNADEDKVFEIMKNLVNNAIKYSSQHSQIEVETEEKNASVEIKVVDHGIGIPEEQKDQVFRKFFRADNAARLQTEGNGLGLYIVKSFVAAHKGNITFESKEGEGTTFILTLPKN